MSKLVRLNVVDQRLLTNPEAYALLKKAVERIVSKEGSAPLLLTKTLEYLEKHSKIPPESVTSVREMLKNMGFKDETIVMIINICPKSVDELRALLDFEDRILEEQTLKEVVELMKSYCK